MGVAASVGGVAVHGHDRRRRHGIAVGTAARVRGTARRREHNHHRQ